jgi:N-succinyldiaminopimelate aminotransferase
MPRFPDASRTNDSLSAGVFSALAKRASTHTGKVFPLHVGDTWREPWPGLRAEAVSGELLYTYAPVRGEPALLSAARAQCERRAGPLPDRTFCVVSGATSGISVVMQTLCDVGDEVVLPAPFWPLVRGIIASRGAVPVEVPLWDRRGGPNGVDVEAALEAAVTPRTVALYVNSPHNPTGGMLSEDEAAAFARVAERHGLWLVVDEVYEHLWFGEVEPRPLWARPDFAGRSVAVHSLSKAYGFAGGRVGWVHGPHAVMERVVATQTHQVYCAPKVMQLGAAAALSGADAWLAETRELYREAGRKTAEAFGVEAPLGGTFLFVDASPWLSPEDDATELLVRLLDEAGVLLTPGVSSGRDYGRWMRVCFTAVAPDVLDEALGRVSEVLRRVERERRG